MSAGKRFGSKNHCPTTQNAGCTMAIHARCTKSKIQQKYNQLFLKDFIESQMLAQTVQPPLHGLPHHGAVNYEHDSRKVCVPVFQLRSDHPAPPGWRHSADLA
ncbi:Hypothetical protein PSF113_4268 [Pseudomonas ogarae]|nr:Hypothetical protein PSF113_4268 [Pseudomonas ogarae]